VLHGTASRTGSDQYNQALSQRRVRAVRDHLLARGAQSNQLGESATGETDARLAGQRDKTEDSRFRAVLVTADSVAPSATVRVHPTDHLTHRVPSVRGPRGKTHFVTARRRGAVVLEAVPSDPQATLTWEVRNEHGHPVMVTPGGTPQIVCIPADTAARLSVRLLIGGCAVWDGFVWVVWATISATPRADLTVSDATDLQVGRGFDFVHTLAPASMFDQTADIPDLTGPKTTPLPGGTNHAGNSLQGGADRKWDNSRKIRKRFVNPSGIPLASIGGNPSFHTTFPDYPSAADGDGHPGGAGAIDADLVAIVGNDDAGTGDPEDNDPYTDPDRGALTGTDLPKRTMPHAVGADGDTVEWRLHFLEFTRFEIGRRWVRISDDFPWRSHLRMRRAGGRWVDNGSLKELNNSGF
jgi:hypothetical protein